MSKPQKIKIIFKCKKFIFINQKISAKSRPKSNDVKVGHTNTKNVRIKNRATEN
jgi:hypothetical protein